MAADTDQPRRKREMEELCNRSRCLALTINGIILAFVCLMLMLPRKTTITISYLVPRLLAHEPIHLLLFLVIKR